LTVIEEMEARLRAEFAPARLEILDESEAHRGHAGYSPSGASHLRIVMRAELLGSMTRLQRHRAVYDALGPSLVARVHALALDLGA
jgi:BolA protein